MTTPSMVKFPRIGMAVYKSRIATIDIHQIQVDESGNLFLTLENEPGPTFARAREQAEGEVDVRARRRRTEGLRPEQPNTLDVEQL
jgi:hypothetical protein